jgi:sensor histidine kinase YesM
MVEELHVLTKRIFETQSELYEIALEKKQIELNGLQEQINSHFLFNTLNCIRGMALTNEKKQIVDMIENLVSYFRYNARKEEYVTLAEELKHLNTYLAIQKVRFDGSFNIKLSVEERFNSVSIPKFSLQPLIENAIYHGFSQKFKNAVIKIAALKRDDYLIIKVLDNGIGIDPSRLKEINTAIEIGELQPKSDTDKKSIAIVNVHKRLQLYYGKKYGLEIKSWKNIGTAVILKLPLIREEP